jgi:uncharacterized protein (DUF1800 family)
MALSPLSFSTLAGLTVAVGVVLAAPVRAQESPSDHDEIVHVLNRITFGPRPGDVEAVEKMGLHNYIEQQLHPETIDDSAVEQELADFDILRMSNQQLSALFFDERRKALKRQHEEAVRAAIAAGEIPAKTTELASAGDVTPPTGDMTAQANGSDMEARNAATGGDMTMQATAQQGSAEAAPAEPNMLGGKLAGALAKANQYRSVAAVGQLEKAKLIRAVDSERQLQEVLVDFWNNHFNVDVKKGPDRVLKVADDRDVIRPHIWGKFRDLLEADAKSPAMLYYLDNATNTVGHTVTEREVEYAERHREQVTAAGGNPKPMPTLGEKRGGINENYGREIMELHTIGVDAGYTQQDVQEVARCFTGWSIDQHTGEFMFRARNHDDGQKIVMGHVIPAGGGMQDGETVLDILCSMPACAHHISYEMCQRFVSDNPPDELVQRVAGVFTETGGDLRAVTEAILTSPEFLSPANYNNKIKSPLEFAVSAVRASRSSLVPHAPAPFDKLAFAMEGGAILGRGTAADRVAKLPRQSLNWHIYELGEPLFACTPPTGYKEVSTTWVSPGALIERLNFALALTQQKIADVKFDAQSILAGIDLDDPNAVLKRSVDVLLQGNISDSTHKVLQESALTTQGDSKTVDPSKLIALIIGSPEFQRK